MTLTVQHNQYNKNFLNLPDATKADIDLANITSTGIDRAVGWLQLNLNAKILVINQSPYTIPADCFCNIAIGSNQQNQTMEIERNGVSTTIYNPGTYQGDVASVALILKKGDIFKTTLTGFAMEMFPFIK